MKISSVTRRDGEDRILPYGSRELCTRSSLVTGQLHSCRMFFAVTPGHAATL